MPSIPSRMVLPGGVNDSDGGALWIVTYAESVT